MPMFGPYFHNSTYSEILAISAVSDLTWILATQ